MAYNCVQKVIRNLQFDPTPLNNAKQEAIKEKSSITAKIDKQFILSLHKPAKTKDVNVVGKAWFVN
jgi:hypothetical protein